MSETTKKKRTRKTKEPTFEESMKALAEIVEKLEAGDLPLAESIRLFEEGMRLANASQAQLDQAERRVEALLSVDENGNPETEPL